MPEVQINESTVVRVQISEYRGTTRLDIRNWFFNDEGKCLPTKKGVSLEVVDVVDLLDAIHETLPDLVESWASRFAVVR